MLSVDLKLGDSVKFISERDFLDASKGDIGIITEIDTSDYDMTYRVMFISGGPSYWYHNRDLEQVFSEDMECNWKNRALLAEKQLQELKEALKTLAEG